MNGILLDTKTGKRERFEGPRSWEWAENGWSCDCNRQIVFEMWDDGGTCLGCHRFIVVVAEFFDEDYVYSLYELNSDYPDELLAEHGIHSHSVDKVE